MNEKPINSSYIRQTNQFNVLKYLCGCQETTIADLAKLCNTTIVTLGKIVQVLQQKNVISSYANQSGKVGRHGRLYSLNLAQGLFVCMDLTFKENLTAKLYNVKMQETAYFKKPVKKDYADAFYALNEDIKDYAVKANMPVLGVGVSIAGICDKDADKMLSTLYDWYDQIAPYSFLSNCYKTQNIIIGQDVTFAALAQSKKLIKNAKESLYYLYIGDGVGGALVTGNTPYVGADQIAGDTGQVLVNTKEGFVRLEDIVSIDRLLAAKSGDFERRMEILYSSIYNIVWLINPNYLVINATEGGINDFIYANIKKFLSDKKPQIPITTKFMKSDVADASLIGVLQQLTDAYFRSL